MLSVTIIPTRKCYPKYAEVAESDPPQNIPSRKSYPKVKTEKIHHAQKSLPSRKSYLRTHENRPSRKLYLCTKTDTPETIHHPLVLQLSHAPSQKEGVVLCASVGAINQIVDL